MKSERKPNILIVDDIQQNIEFIEAIIKPLRVNIIKASSGEEAIAKIRNHELALALIDVQMPGMSGIELATTILQENHREIFPIIFITAYSAQEQNLELFYKSGITDYIQKPFRKSILLSKVKVFLELHKQKQRLADSEQMYRTLLNASPEGIVIMDISGSIREISTIALQVLGIERREGFTGKSFFTFLPEKEVLRFKEIIDKALKDKLAQNVEFRICRPDSTQFISEISTTLINDINGDPSALMAIIRDISQRKQAEQQQIQTERMASLGEMATGIAHEINQPLNNISFGIDNLLTEIGNHKEIDHNYFEKKSRKIFANIERISYIIDHIRTFSQGQDDIMRISFSINDSIRNGVSLISEQLKGKGIDLILHLDDTVDMITGNTYQFEQVILNLLLNAKDAIQEKIKLFSEDFNKEIQITSYQKSRTIFVEVTDTGIGMTPGSINHVMFPFYTTKESGKGTGLGLSISLGIIKDLNGTIEVESNYSEGTTLRIVIPVDGTQV
ncbi:MAG: response regulator [Bacteroidales bacterium]|nr:response regulator [Bacteroidales bacterium]